MNKSLLKKIATLILIIIVLRILLIVLLDHVNVYNSHYIETVDHEIILNQILDNYLYTIVDKSKRNDNSVSTYIKSDDKQEFSLLIHNLTFEHEIYINDQLVSQNIDVNEPYYNSDYAYKAFYIKKANYIGNTVKVSIIGDYTNMIDIFLAKDNVMRDSQELRTVLSVIVLLCFLLSTLISFLLYCYRQREYYFLIFVVMGIVSSIKMIALGEIPIFCESLGFTARHYTFIDKLTTLINTILPLFIVCYLFDFKIKLKYIVIGFIAFFALGFGMLIDGRNSRLYYIIFQIIILIGNMIIIIGFIKDKPYSKTIMINSVIYSSCVIYYMLVLSGVYQNGSMLFFMNPAYLGAVAYMGGFLLVAFLKHLDKVRILENKKKEYEKVSLLRGLSHDLKLPLSVIKLNNQIIEKYDLTYEEIKEYAETSLGAVAELEDMTNNINSYLNFRYADMKGETTSIKECFEKLEKYYSFHNQYSNFKFTVECDEKDCILNISPVHFDRMLCNLVDNSFKYNKKGGYVKVSYKIDKKIIIMVKDNGIGMDTKQIHKIFEPFYRIDQSRSKEGLGLGLSVVKEIVDYLKGTIEMKSEKGVGTQVIITLPK